ncbi:hypothetical protein FKW77_000721 [Venturia effusa]|uniref:CRAL-TRIO domain-containing protein n=1 Tax=Venturia effusa TaxID=50376 RepID=A0A517LQH7_9PEZI|nr:hypothetical protein FKW77_000721 [Venturia effusa]
MAELTKVDSFQYPNGHLGHLSDNQQRALDDFKVLCEKEGYYTTKAEGGKPASHDDETLLRYLRARKFVPKEALTQFKATEDWRKENKLEELYDTIDITEYDETRRLVGSQISSVYVFEVAPLNSKALNAYEKSVTKKPTVTHNETKVSSKMLRLFALYENLTRFVLPLCTAIKDRPHPETPISQSNNIVDISNVGLKQFWNLKSHMQDASQLATAYYPETLDRIFIIGAPSFFPTVWSWVKRWFDPITVSKIFILSAADMKPTLEQYIAIENIPKKYGGTLEYEFGMLPMLEEEISNNLKWTNPSADMQSGKKSYPTGPIKWRASSATIMEAVAVGSENGKRREEAIATVETSFDDIHGISRVNTTIDWSLEKVRSTSGTATQPADDGDPNYGSELRDPSLDEPNAVAAGAVQANNTTTLPARPLDTGNNDLPPSNTQPRTGTSDTRLEQQDADKGRVKATHAAGTVASGTPHTINYGQHDKASTMEPSTVGQAPKDVSANLANSADPEAPGYLAQAQNMASQVVASAAGAVGLGSTTGDKEKAGGGEEEAQKDKRVDGVKDEVVEEYLRTKVPSTDPTAQGKA